MQEQNPATEFGIYRSRRERVKPDETPTPVELAQQIQVDISHWHGVELAERIINETEEVAI
jgi:hypothetical protein